MERKTHIIDATNKSLGRLAGEIAILLRGKQKVNFVPYKDIGDFVIVKNVDKIRFTGKKIFQKVYRKHSGYLGHLKEIKLETLFKKRPDLVLKRAVYGMLPKNKLRDKFIKRLKFE
ncbi:MAG: 50S ribosomal protein L13 [Minisyncoccia bacterium]